MVGYVVANCFDERMGNVQMYIVIFEGNRKRICLRDMRHEDYLKMHEMVYDTSYQNQINSFVSKWHKRSENITFMPFFCI